MQNGKLIEIVLSITLSYLLHLKKAERNKQIPLYTGCPARVLRSLIHITCNSPSLQMKDLRTLTGQPINLAIKQ